MSPPKKRGLLDRIFRRGPTIEPPRLPEREPVADLIARMPLPQRDVTPADVSIYNLPLNFGAIKTLGLAVNRLKRTPIEQFDVQRLKPDESVYIGIPMVASVVAHHFNPEIPVVLPTQEEVMAMKPWVRDVAQFLGKSSSQWEKGVGGFAKRLGEDVVRKKAEGISKPVDLLGSVVNPQKQFVQEVGTIYQSYAEPVYDEGLRPIEEKMPYLLQNLRDIRDGIFYHRDLTRDSLPILRAVLPAIKFPTDAFINEQGEKIAVGGSEVMRGLHVF